MAIKRKAGGRIRGLSSDTKPTAAAEPVDTIFEETDTGDEFRNTGSAWALSKIGDLTTLVTWIVYKAGSTYKARSGGTRFSSTNLVTVWNSIRSNPQANCIRIHFLNNTETYDIPSGSTLDLPSAAKDYHVSGESMHGVRIRPLGNNQCMSMTNLRRAKFDNFGFYVDQGTAYTQDIMRVNASSGGCEAIEIGNIKFRHDDGTGPPANLVQTGRNLAFVLGGTDPNVSWTNVHDCWMLGSDSAIVVTSSAPLGYPWFNENWFTNIEAQHTKRFFLSTMPAITGADPLIHVTNSHMHRLILRNCSWQTTHVEATTLHFFHISTNVKHRGILLDGCFMWDPQTTTPKFLNINSTDVRLAANNCEPLADKFMGGTSWDATNNKWVSGVHIRRENELCVKRGLALSVADGGTITHGMIDYKEESTTEAITPKNVRLTGTVAGEIITPTALTASTITVSIKKIDPTATTAALAIVPGTTQNIYWIAEAYN